jgi:serine/threonine-protein kinase
VRTAGRSKRETPPADVGRYNRGRFAVSLAPGVRLGAYEVISLIGVGGMGEVYRARDTRLGRTVALKVLAPSASNDDSARQRLFREARTVSSLDHPNVCALYEVGSAEGIDYLVMQYLDGETLSAVLRRGPLPVERAIRHAIEVLTALEAAHAHGIVHRDLKPGNVMITPVGARLLDFGLAVPGPRAETLSSEQISGSTQTVLTGFGTLRGTLPYMAPEQFDGYPADARSDIFAFGAVFYEMLTGHRAFVADDDAGVLTKIIGSSPPPPSRINSDVPPALDVIVSKCLAKRPSERWQSADELRDALRRAAETVVAPTRVPRWAYAFTAAMLVATGALIALGVPALWTTGNPASSSAEPAATIVAVLPFESDSSDPAERAYWAGLSQAVATTLAELPPAQRIHVAAGDGARTVRSPAEARVELGATRVLRARVSGSGVTANVELELIDPAAETTIRRATLMPHRGAPAEAHNAIVTAALGLLGVAVDERLRATLRVRETTTGAYDYYLQALGYLRDYDRPENVDTAITVLTHALELDPDHALTHAGLGTAYWRKYVATRDSAWIDRARSSCERALGLDEAAAAPHLCLGTVEKGIGRYERSVQEYLHALERDPASEQAYVELADAYEKLKQPEKAEETYRHAIALRPRYWLSYSQLGAFYSRSGRYAEAETAFRQVIALNPDSWRAYSNLGAMHWVQGRPREAVDAFEQSLSLRPNALAASNLGTVYFYALADYPRAARAFRQALDLNPTDYLLWGNYGWALYWAGNRQSAREAFEQAIPLAEARRHVNPRNAASILALAEYHAVLEHTDLARTLLGEALALAPTDPGIAYRAGVTYEFSLQDRQQALQWLTRALEAGHPYTDLEREPALARMRRDGDVEKLRQIRPAPSTRGGT